MIMHHNDDGANDYDRNIDIDSIDDKYYNYHMINGSSNITLVIIRINFSTA